MKVVVDLSNDNIEKLQKCLDIQFEVDEEGDLDSDEVADAITILIECC